MLIKTQKGIAAFVAAALSTSAALPATAAPAANPAPIAQARTDDGATDFSARRYRHGGNAAAAAMFGAVAGTIATIAINEQRRKRQRDYYRYGYYGQPGYYAPQAYYAPQTYYAPRPYYAPRAYGYQPRAAYGQHHYFGAAGTQFGGAVSAPQASPGTVSSGN